MTSVRKSDCCTQFITTIWYVGTDDQISESSLQTWISFSNVDFQEQLVWERIRKRVDSVNVIKAKQCYQNYVLAVPRDQRDESSLATPPAEDRGVPTRKWQYEVSQWDKALKQWSPGQTGA